MYRIVAITWLSIYITYIESISLRGNRRLQDETEVAWLLSFPNSGTTYTQRLVQATSRRSVASNYGHENINEQGNVEKVDHSIPVHDGSWSGPFRTSKILPLPESGFVLTKTHCGGYCFSDCPPTWYRLSPLKFLQECRLGMRHDVSEYGSRETWVQYDYSLVKRVVHLFRSPFENIVSRFFHEIKIHGMRKDTAFLKKYPKSPEGFKAWCTDTDTKWKFHEITAWGPDFFQAAQGVPCHGELTRIVRWHNNAFALHDALQVPTLLLHYGDFNDEFTKTLQKLLSFLHLKKEADPVPFLYSNHDQYYLPWERVKMSQFMRYLATPQTLKHLERYLVDDLEKEQKLLEQKQMRDAQQPGFLFYNVKSTSKELLPSVKPEQMKQIQVHTIPSNNTEISRTQELLFYNNNPKPEITTNKETEQKILNLINNDWQNTNITIETKMLHVQAGIQKISMLSEMNGDGTFHLQFFKKDN